ncbi:MAG: hypothetical protein A3F12_04020 [Gammaproteobacteria bacterium RIFCSPHIGHO2_12_FULL_38_14]|nr:MAG: hypothetical protein A3F12_04020 [Gammaproteobacteria bacterium RIFCSPHIGHO2_12_FULL_38_14]
MQQRTWPLQDLKNIEEKRDQQLSRLLSYAEDGNVEMVQLYIEQFGEEILYWDTIKYPLEKGYNKSIYSAITNVKDKKARDALLQILKKDHLWERINCGINAIHLDAFLSPKEFNELLKANDPRATERDTTGLSPLEYKLLVDPQSIDLKDPNIVSKIHLANPKSEKFTDQFHFVLNFISEIHIHHLIYILQTCPMLTVALDLECPSYGLTKQRGNKPTIAYIIATMLETNNPLDYMELFNILIERNEHINLNAGLENESVALLLYSANDYQTLIHALPKCPEPINFNASINGNNIKATFHQVIDRDMMRKIYNDQFKNRDPHRIYLNAMKNFLKNADQHVTLFKKTKFLKEELVETLQISDEMNTWAYGGKCAWFDDKIKMSPIASLFYVENIDEINLILNEKGYEVLRWDINQYPYPDFIESVYFWACLSTNKEKRNALLKIIYSHYQEMNCGLSKTHFIAFLDPYRFNNLVKANDPSIHVKDALGLSPLQYVLLFNPTQLNVNDALPLIQLDAPTGPSETQQTPFIFYFMRFHLEKNLWGITNLWPSLSISLDLEDHSSSSSEFSQTPCKRTLAYVLASTLTLNYYEDEHDTLRSSISNVFLHFLLKNKHNFDINAGSKDTVALHLLLNNVALFLTASQNKEINYNANIELSNNNSISTDTLYKLVKNKMVSLAVMVNENKNLPELVDTLNSIQDDLHEIEAQNNPPPKKKSHKKTIAPTPVIPEPVIESRRTVSDKMNKIQESLNTILNPKGITLLVKEIEEPESNNKNNKVKQLSISFQSSDKPLLQALFSKINGKKNSFQKITCEDALTSFEIIGKETSLFSVFDDNKFKETLKSIQSKQKKTSIDKPSLPPPPTPKNYLELTDTIKTELAKDIYHAFCKSSEIVFRWENDTLIVKMPDENQVCNVIKPKRDTSLKPTNGHAFSDHFVQEQILSRIKSDKNIINDCNMSGRSIRISFKQFDQKDLNEFSAKAKQFHAQVFSQLPWQNETLVKIPQPKVTPNKKPDDPKKEINIEDAKNLFRLVGKTDNLFSFLENFKREKNGKEKVINNNQIKMTYKHDAHLGIGPIIYLDYFKAIQESINSARKDAVTLYDPNKDNRVIMIVNFNLLQDLTDSETKRMQDHFATLKENLEQESVNQTISHVSERNSDHFQPPILQNNDQKSEMHPITFNPIQYDHLCYHLTSLSNFRLSSSPSEGDFYAYLSHAQQIFILLSKVVKNAGEKSDSIFWDGRNILRHCYFKKSFYEIYETFQPFIQYLSQLIFPNKTAEYFKNAFANPSKTLFQACYIKSLDENMIEMLKTQLAPYQPLLHASKQTQYSPEEKKKKIEEIHNQLIKIDLSNADEKNKQFAKIALYSMIGELDRDDNSPYRKLFRLYGHHGFKQLSQDWMKDLEQVYHQSIRLLMEERPNESSQIKYMFPNG